MTTKKIYLASSWRNPYQPELCQWLREQGFEVYDFRNPQTGGPDTEYDVARDGFSWRHVDPTWGDGKGDMLQRYREMLKHEVAREGFASDFNAMRWADTCVLLLPSGRSAHIEAGWMSGAGKKMVVFHPPVSEPCVGCGGSGQSGRLFPHDACMDCNSKGWNFRWNFEPELMYLVGGNPQDVIVTSKEELLASLRKPMPNRGPVSAAEWKDWARENVIPVDLRIRQLNDGRVVVRGRVGPASTSYTVWSVSAPDELASEPDVLRQLANLMDGGDA